MNFRRLVLAAVTLAGLSACSSPLEPESLVGEYWNTGGHRSLELGGRLYQLLSDELHVLDGSRIVQTIRSLETDLATLETTQRVLVTEWEYVVDGARLRVLHPDSPDAVLLDLPEYFVLAGGEALVLAEHGVTYRRK